MYDKAFFEKDLSRLAAETGTQPGLEITLMNGEKFDIATIHHKEDEYLVCEIFPPHEMEKIDEDTKLDRIILSYNRIMYVRFFIPEPSKIGRMLFKLEK